MQSLQKSNAEMLSTIMQQRKDIEGMMSGLERVVTDLDESLAHLPHDEMLALTNETVALDDMARSSG